MAYTGSFVTFGQGEGIVVAIADATETGRISQLIQGSTGLKTPLTRKIDKFSKTLLYVILGLAALTFAVGLGQGGSLINVFKASVALVVSAIPEGLPAIVTVTLAIGVSRMAINGLVAAEVFYLLSITQFLPSVFARIQGKSTSVAYAPAIKIVGVVILQCLFSQWGMMNQVFDTTPLTFTQALICLGAGFPVVLIALILQRFNPLN